MFFKWNWRNRTADNAVCSISLEMRGRNERDVGGLKDKLNQWWFCVYFLFEECYNVTTVQKTRLYG